ncbi:MAG: PorV/PorQ family protein [Elusimicrobia bacterium]|nr:PorV/PorQ family protein [Elusimicrobiota bacterium]
MKHRNTKIKPACAKFKIRLITGYVLFLGIVMASINANSAFLDIGYGARPVAMGQAFTAISDDINATHTNPAGLAFITVPEISALYGRMYEGLSDNSEIGQGHFGFAYPVKKYIPGTLGFSWEELNLTEAYSETSFTLSYGTEVYKNIFAGLNLKMLRKSYSSDIYTEADPLFNNGYSKSAIALDLGGLYRVNSQYTLGLAVRNINQPDMGIANKDMVPMQIRGGVAYWKNNGVIDLDMSYSDSDYDISMGIEHWLSNKFTLRFGLLAGNDSRRNFSLGLGSKFSSFQFDYAFSLPIGGIAQTVGSHRFSFSMRFGAHYDINTALAAKNIEDLRVQLSGSLRAMDEARAQAASQEKQIKELSKKVEDQNDKIDSLAIEGVERSAKFKGVDISSGALNTIEVQMMDIARELEKSKREVQIFKNKISGLEKRLAGKKDIEKKSAAFETQTIGGKKVYVVESGDTLRSVAEKVYGDSSKWIEIYKANSNNVGRSGRIEKGQILTVP